MQLYCLQLIISGYVHHMFFFRVYMQSRRNAGHLSYVRQTALRNTRRMRSKREHCGIRLLSHLHRSQIDPAEICSGYRR